MSATSSFRHLVRRLSRVLADAGGAIAEGDARFWGLAPAPRALAPLALAPLALTPRALAVAPLHPLTQETSR